MQNMREAAHHHSASINSVKSVIEINKYCRTLIEGCNPIKILKWTEKSNANFMTSLAEESNAK